MPWDIDRPYSENAKDKDWLPQKPRRTRKEQQRRAMAVLAGATVGLLGLGATIVHVKSGNSERAAINERQPKCDLPVGQGGTIGGLRFLLNSYGDTNPGEAQIVAPDGHIRNRDDDPTINGEIMLHVDDTVRFEHVHPRVCEMALTRPEWFFRVDETKP